MCAECCRSPKYGNDDDYVDNIFGELSLWLQDRIRQEKIPTVRVCGVGKRSGCPRAVRRENMLCRMGEKQESL